MVAVVSPNCFAAGGLQHNETKSPDGDIIGQKKVSCLRVAQLHRLSVSPKFRRRVLFHSFFLLLVFVVCLCSGRKTGNTADQRGKPGDGFLVSEVTTPAGLQASPLPPTSQQRLGIVSGIP